MKYIGQRRCKCEIAQDDYWGSGTYIKKDIEKHGIENFKKIILGEYSNEDELNGVEKEIIRLLKANDSKEYYNIAPGGKRRPNGFIPSDNEIRKINYLRNVIMFENIYSARASDDYKDSMPRITLNEIFYVNNHYEEISFLFRKGDKVDKRKYKTFGNVLINVGRSDITPESHNFIGYLKNNKLFQISKDEFYNLIKLCTDKRNFDAIYKKLYERSNNSIKPNGSSIDDRLKNEEIFESSNTNNSDLIGFIKNQITKSKDYKILYELIEKYPKLGITAIYDAVTGSASLAEIKSGKIKISGMRAEKADEVLKYDEKVYGYLQNVKGRKDYLLIVINYCYYHDEINNEKLFTKISKRYNHIKTITSLSKAASEIEYIYNYREKDKVNIALDFQKKRKSKCK